MSCLLLGFGVLGSMVAVIRLDCFRISGVQELHSFVLMVSASLEFRRYTASGKSV